LRVGFGALTSIAIATLAGGEACQRHDEDADLLPPAGWSPPSTQSVVTSPAGKARFGPGWYPVESNEQGSWRWMGQSGEIRVPSLPAKARLEFAGWAPVELLLTPPVMEISINGHKLDHFELSRGRFKKVYEVPQDFQREQADSVVRLETSATAKAPDDPRALGFSLLSVRWMLAPQ
jgi:hypothetical protein